MDSVCSLTLRTLRTFAGDVRHFVWQCCRIAIVANIAAKPRESSRVWFDKAPTDRIEYRSSGNDLLGNIYSFQFI